MKRVVLLLCVLFLSLAHPCYAQYRDGRMWTVGSGIDFPMGPDSFADRWKSGFGLVAGVHHCFDRNQRVSVRALLEYHRLSANRNDELLNRNLIDPLAPLTSGY